MAKSNLTKMANFNTSIREIDFVTMFARNWDALMALFGIMRPIKKEPGTKLTSTVAKVTLQPTVGEGEEIPYSLAELKDVAYGDIVFDKKCKAVSIEAIAKYGAAKAITMTDEEFLNELQGGVLTDFYSFLKTGILTGAYSTFQMSLAMAKGLVLDKFKKMRKTVTEVVGFCNILDAYSYLGSSVINNVETRFGMDYIENFMGYKTLFLLSDPDIPRGKVIALPVNNIDLYYIDPADSQFAQAGLEYTVDGVTPLIGFHVMGNYSTAVGECYSLMGMALWAEFLDGIAVLDIGSEAFTAVVSPAADANPFALNYYEKDANNNYFHSVDTTVDDTKTYYTRAVTPAA